MDRRRPQALILRLVGSVELLAFGAVVMPFAWMETVHGWLGVGELPQGAVIESLLRQVSFTYGLHGVGMWVIAVDVDRFRPLVALTAFGYLAAGPVFLVIDFLEGMPWFWMVGNGGACLVIGVLLFASLIGDWQSAY
jgi:hypothetical protein